MTGEGARTEVKMLLLGAGESGKVRFPSFSRSHLSALSS